MIKLIIIAGLLFSHSVFAASKGRQSLKTLLSCDISMRTDLPSNRAELFKKTKRVFEKYDLMDKVIEDFQARLKISEEVLVAMIRSLAVRINDVRDTTPADKFDAEINELEALIDAAMTPIERNFSSYIGFSAAGKKQMETRHFGDDWSDLDPTPKPQQQQQMRPLNPPPPPPPDYGGWSLPGFRPNWPPREKP